MFIQPTSIRAVFILVLVITLGGVLLGLLTFDTFSRLPPVATAIAQATVAQSGTPEPGTPTGDTPIAVINVNLEWLVIAALIGVIVGLAIGISLTRPIINP